MILLNIEKNNWGRGGIRRLKEILRARSISVECMQPGKVPILDSKVFSLVLVQPNLKPSVGPSGKPGLHHIPKPEKANVLHCWSLAWKVVFDPCQVSES